MWHCALITHTCIYTVYKYIYIYTMFKKWWRNNTRSHNSIFVREKNIYLCIWSIYKYIYVVVTTPTTLTTTTPTTTTTSPGLDHIIFPVHQLRSSALYPAKQNKGHTGIFVIYNMCDRYKKKILLIIVHWQIADVVCFTITIFTFSLSQF